MFVEDALPWVYPVAGHLVEGPELRPSGPVRLPNGGNGLRFRAYSATYDRILAEYWTDPSAPAGWLLQWRKIYLDFWGSGEREEEEAQRARMSLYEQLNGLPVKMEERFRLLTQARVLRLEKWEDLPPEGFSIPEGYVEKTVSEIIWDGWLHRLERWFRPRQELR